MMNYLVPKSSFGLAAAGASVACFVGYCIYFDRKRRSDPLFKQKLLEKRKKANKPSTGGGSGSSSEMPDLRDTESMQRFFLQEVQLGEELLATGDIESGVEHLSNAVAVCGQAQQLLQVLQQTLPPKSSSYSYRGFPWPDSASPRVQLQGR